MNFLKNNKNKLSFILVSALLILIPLYLFSCSGDDYKTAEDFDPKINVLISPEDLNNWITNGCPEDEYGMNKVVILHVGDDTSYGAGHVPGALLLNTSEVVSTRSDGVSDTIGMVAGKSQMDTAIQRTGIDGGTIVVLTAPSSSNDLSFFFLSRAYFNFRYWGFPRNRVRVLDGFVDTTWTDAGYSLQSTAPTVEASDYSVCNLTPDPDRFRAPLEEMINIAKDNDPKTVVIDTRTADEYNGVPNQTPGPDGSSYVAFEGRIRTAVWQNYTDLLDTAADNKLISKAGLQAAMDAINVNSSTTAYPYCRTAYRAAITFLALDGVLNYPVKLYDGSWIEWGQMTGWDRAAITGAISAGSNLDINSLWKTDAGFDGSYPPWITIDNADGITPSTTYTDSGILYPAGPAGTEWTTETLITGFYGTDYRLDSTAGSSPTQFAIWAPQLPSAGNYKVWIIHPASGSVYASNAEFIINHSGTSDTVTVNFRSGTTENGIKGTWHLLGTYAFTATNDDSENVTMRDLGADGRLFADAVRFTLDDGRPLLSEAITYNTTTFTNSLEALDSANSFAPHADEINVQDAACAGGGGGGAAPPSGGN